MQAPVPPLPADLVVRGVALLHQQCWCWGADIRRAEGNLLLAYGFKRRRPPAPVRGSSHYILEREGGARVHLWGFGAVWQEQQAAVFVGRYEFLPALVPAEALGGDVWAREQLRLSPVPPPQWAGALASLARFCRFSANYERWVLRTVGLAWREQVLADWSEPAATAADFAASWDGLAEMIEACSEREPLATR